jgi:hypothetical protein
MLKHHFVELLTLPAMFDNSLNLDGVLIRCGAEDETYYSFKMRNMGG